MAEREINPHGLALLTICLAFIDQIKKKKKATREGLAELFMPVLARLFVGRSALSDGKKRMPQKPWLSFSYFPFSTERAYPAVR